MAQMTVSMFNAGVEVIFVVDVTTIHNHQDEPEKFASGTKAVIYQQGGGNCTLVTVGSKMYHIPFTTRCRLPEDGE